MQIKNYLRSLPVRIALAVIVGGLAWAFSENWPEKEGPAATGASVQFGDPAEDEAVLKARIQREAQTPTGQK